MNEYLHNFMNITHKALDLHLDHEQQRQIAMTHNLFYQLPLKVMYIST